ncbi:MAG: chemotaxis protein CheR, partial [Burkholderiales bacterium]|nr:chemotaxis protein CheR [Burkholderiales bacterium]
MTDAGRPNNESMNATGTMPARIEQLVRQATGLRVRESDRERLLQWAGERAHGLGGGGVGGAEAYCRMLTEDGDIAQHERELLSAQFTTGESYFFRDLGQIDLLASKLLPELIARRAGERKLRLWSAGCAAGQEAYTLAMLVHELSPRLAGWDVRILGSDIDGAALEQARRGVFGSWSFRALDETRRQRYFHASGDQWKIDPLLRAMVSFRHADLLRDRFPDAATGLEHIDLILCRNVFIYLDAEAVSRITAQFAATLDEGGYLITGHSELFGHQIAPLRTRMF